ncbi:MAG: choice-of-anchor D domain-containing protein [Kofleriaceae bacterium]
MVFLQRLQFFTIALLVVATPASAFALSAADVAVGDVDVATSGSATGTIMYSGTSQTLANIDTSACTGFTVTHGTTLPMDFVTAADALPFTAEYTAAARGAASCAVVLRAGDASTLGTFTITARGVAAELSISATALTFGDVRLTGGTATRTFDVMNTGDTGKLLTVSGIAASSGAAGDFTATPTAFTLSAGLSRQITVTFDPSATGPRASSLIVTSDDPVAATEMLTLDGAGVNPVIGTAEDPTDFGVVAPGGTATRMIAVSNTGSGTLSVTEATLSPSAGSWFTFTTIPQASCNGNASTCTYSPALAIGATPVNVEVRCSPPASVTNTTPQTRTLTFTSDSAAGGDPSVTLTCTPGNPQVTPNPTSMTFGNVELVTMSTPQTLTVTNTGNTPLSISSANLVAGAHFMVAMGQTGAQTVMPGQDATWSLLCYPMAEGPLSDSFRILSNATNSPTLNIPLSCTGGRLVSNVTSFDFGSVRAGDSVTRTFTLRNTGPVTVSGITAMFSPQANAKGYTVVAATLPPSLAANGTATVTVRFSPTDTLSGTQPGETHTLRIVGTYGAAQATMTQTMNLLGDGLSSGYTFDPATFDMGAVRWDLTIDRTFQIKNPFEAPVTITGLTLTPTLTTVTGEITRVGLLGPNGAPASFPITLNNGQALTVTLRANPANRLGALTANADASSDLGATAMPTRRLAVTATSTTPAITADPPTMMYDFGPVDVDRPAATKTLSLKNTGDGILDVTSATIVGAGSPYSVTAVTPFAVAPNGTFDVTVAYDPSAVRSDPGSLVIGVSGVFGGTMTTSFALSGRGIDRTFAVTEPGLFPETYRNPGSKAPTQDVLVRNLGEAPLTISALMVTGEPVWSLVNPAPVVVPGLGSTTFTIKFSPTTGGKAPTGSLMITHDDDTSANRAIVMLEGFGKNPMLSVTPSASISLGTTAVGFPVRLSETFPDQLTVQNNDTAKFRVREVRLRDPSGESAFALTDDLSGQDLDAGETRRFDIVFSAAAVGEFTAQMEIYLEEDTEPATIVQITGTAVEVEVQGGGGCQTGGHGAGALVLLVAGLALTLRRRRAAAPLAALLVLVGGSQAARAQSSRNLDIATFRPAPATTGELMQVEAPTVGDTGDWQIDLAISHARDPLQVTTSMGDTFNLVSQRTMFDLGVALAFARRVEVGARVATMSQDGDADGSTVRGLEPGSGSALGDVLLHTKVTVLRGAKLGVSAAANLTLPTATDDAFAGAGGVAAGGAVIVGGAGRRLSAAANLGFTYQPKVTLGNITQGNRATVGLGAAWRATDAISLSAELFGALGVGQVERRAASPFEALVGMRYRATRTVGISVGLGTGVVRGIGAPAMHGVLAFELAPNAPSIEPLRPPKPYVPPPDADGDGVADADDQCPTEAEDLDGFGDTDGCPDPDNDFDGVLDGIDKCPSVGEDKDGVEDDDGCPDLDDDHDGVPEPADKCPTVAEDKDGFEDGDGCPDLDDDHDGLLDGEDKCPREPETINGNEDNDGCPDAGVPSVLPNVGRFDLVQPITFVGQGVKLTPDSLNVLGQVAATLRANPEIARMRIGVHTNKRGPKDKDLTERRAAVIRDWLVQWGIGAERLEVRGFGSDRMLVKPQRKNANLVNNRVEFTVMERR